MSKSAFVLGASGQVGRAVINSLLNDGWHVRAGSRTTYEWPVDVEGVLVDREVDSSVVEALAGGADVLIDCVAYSDTHARQVLALEGLIGSAVVLSSVSVYADSSGRTLDEAQRVDDFPEFPVPVSESQTRTRPGDRTYSTRKVAMEDVLVSANAALPVTVLRPGAISGPGSVHPRELWFVKRALDHRPVQLLNWGGPLDKLALPATRPSSRKTHGLRGCWSWPRRRTRAAEQLPFARKSGRGRAHVHTTGSACPGKLRAGLQFSEAGGNVTNTRKTIDGC